MKTHTLPGILTVQATPEIKVSYDAHFNLVEVIHGNKVIRSEVAPRNYTVSAFVRTLQQVRDYFETTRN